jgi:hypothetical protein
MPNALRGVRHIVRVSVPAIMRNIVRRIALIAALSACLASSSAVAASMGVATWNVGWLLDQDMHARWATACASLGWPTQTDALAPAARASLAGLPFCNVHNGMVFPTDACRSTRDDWPRAARYPDDHPCRDTADLSAWPRYEQKLDALRTMFRRLAARGVDIVALQEVSSAAAVRAIVPRGWSVATTRELPGTPSIAQHVGIAWRTSIDLRDIEAVNALSNGGIPGRPLRPGLAFTIDVDRQPVRMLVVHLKAGCRSRDIDAPLAARDAALATTRQDAIASDCAMMRFQLPALEAWIDAQTSGDFAVLGDFNRTLLREPAVDSGTYHTRHDGGDPRTPIGPCTMVRTGARLTPQCPARTRALFPEINDSEPAGAVLWRARFTDLGRSGQIAKGSSGDCSIAGAHGDLTHDGVDHVLISESLKRRLTPGALTLRLLNYADAQGRPLQGASTLAMPSDHCPHLVEWTPVLR